VTSLRRSLYALLVNDQKIATNDLQNLDGVIAKLQEQQAAAPAESLEVNALTRASDVSGRIYVMLMQKEEEAEVSKAATTVASRVISPVEVPLGPTTPKITVTVLAGLLFGFLLGVAAVLARRAFSGRFQSYEEVRRFAPAEIFGIVPLAPQLENNTPRLGHDRQTPFSESIRMLRSNLYQTWDAPGAKIIHITSAAVGDGKSTVAVNLARMLAEDGKGTVLVDADLHQGRLNEFLGLPRAPGVSDFIMGRKAMQYQVPGERFIMIPCGTVSARPSELVNRQRLDELFAELRLKFDYIITDCPPLPVVADTLALARFADIVLSVVYIERTSRRNFALHLNALRARHRPHGIIVNGVANAGTVYGYAYNRRQTLLTRAKRLIA
jgi:capsular exopolysaccharide synthesis family protein